MATRRRFIRDCSALAVSAAFSPSLASAAPALLRDIPIAAIPLKELATLLGSVFVVAAGGPLGPQALELVGVEPRSGAVEPSASAAPGPGRWEAFSLCFRGDPGKALSQDTYRFEHARLGRFEMFIVPVDRPDAHGCSYEAVFHRPAPVPAAAPSAAPSGLPLLAGVNPRRESI